MPVPSPGLTYVGLALTMAATLLLEILDSRVLSVITWYHLSFVAISVAMLGAAAGGLVVFLWPQHFPGERTGTDLARWAARFAVAIVVSHVVTLVVPVPEGRTWTLMELLALAVTIGVVATPFAIGGIVTTLALTRVPLPVNRLYAADLAGAAAGCLAAVLLLDAANLSTAAFAAGTLALGAAVAFGTAATRRVPRGLVALLVLVAAAALGNARVEAVRVLYPKNRQAWTMPVAASLWNSHSHLLAFEPIDAPAYYWGGGLGAERFTTRLAWLLIDGEAGTPITRWNGDPRGLEWVAYDVTTLPYHVRKAGNVAVVGVGGGRDVLGALWSGSRSVTGVEVNGNVIALLSGPFREFSSIVDQPGVRLVHDEARSYLARTPDRFDVLQISLVDTWAATGAGAFTLSENGLYTMDAWRIFLDRLTPTGVLSVSRWFAPSSASETSRLLALAVASLLGRGVPDPLAHLVLMARGNVATLMLSPSALTASDLDRVDALAEERGFTTLVSPRGGGTDPRLDAIARSRSEAELARATADPVFDYTPPTDASPFFFNMIRPWAWFRPASIAASNGVVSGNLRATATLGALGLVSAVFVLLTVLLPLLLRGRPRGLPIRLAPSVAYFAVIGTAFMLTQVGLLQRFSVVMGHPTYALAVVLFAMILFAGLGSLVVAPWIGASRGRFTAVVLGLAAALLVVAWVAPGLATRAAAWPLAARATLVFAIVASLAMLMGVCFPIAADLVQARAPESLPWMWGANGATGVLASIAAVIVSMTLGIEWNLVIAAAGYALLPVLLRAMPTGAPAPSR